MVVFTPNLQVFFRSIQSQTCSGFDIRTLLGLNNLGQLLTSPLIFQNRAITKKVFYLYIAFEIRMFTLYIALKQGPNWGYRAQNAQ
jgi:hypothetical protein